MGCSGHVPPGHWVGVGVMSVGLALSVAGVASPAWRMLDTIDRTIYEGLWQRCDTQEQYEGQDVCVFSSRHSGRCFVNYLESDFSHCQSQVCKTFVWFINVVGLVGLYIFSSLDSNNNADSLSNYYSER
jgi:hypothetical protein